MYTTVTLNLPDELVTRAREAGVLTDERMTALLETELARQTRLAELRRDIHKLRSLQPPLSEEEIAEEIAAERRGER